MAKKLSEIKTGDLVLRWLVGCRTPMRLPVAEVTADRIICVGGWEFDRSTGDEIDADLGWLPGGVTGSRIEPEPEGESGFAE